MTIYLFLRVFLSMIMIIAGMLKFFSKNSFHLTLLALKINHRFVTSITYFIIITELIAGIFLMIDQIYLIGIYIIIVLIISYAWSVYKSLRSKIVVNCNCFGDIIPESLGKTTIIRIVVLLIIDIILLIFPTLISNISAFEITFSSAISLMLLGTYALIRALSDYIHLTRRSR